VNVRSNVEWLGRVEAEVEAAVVVAAA